MAKVQAGIVKEVSDLLKKLFSTIDNAFNKLADFGMKTTDVEEKDGSKIYTVETGSGKHKFKVKVTPVEGTKNKYDLEFKSSKGKIDKKGVTINKEIDLFELSRGVCIEWWGEDSVGDITDTSGESIANSHKLKVSLKKVVSSDGFDIHMCKVFANYSAIQAQSDLQKVLESDEFVEEISEEPKTFEIVDEGETFDIGESEEDVITDVPHLLCAAVGLRDILQYLRWNVCGKSYQSVESSIMDGIWRVESDIDFWGCLCFELQGYTPRPTPLYDATNVPPELGTIVTFNEEQALNYMNTEIEAYIATLEMYECNFSSDVQARIDDILRCWKEKTRYELKKKLM